MSEQTLCVFFTVLIIAFLFVWVPILEFVCPRCSRAIERFRRGRSSRGQVQQRVKTN